MTLKKGHQWLLSKSVIIDPQKRLFFFLYGISFNIVTRITLTLNTPGTIHSHIPIVSGVKWCPRGNTCGWLKASLNTYDFPFLYGPAIDATHTGPKKKRKEKGKLAWRMSHVSWLVFKKNVPRLTDLSPLWLMNR